MLPPATGTGRDLLSFWLFADNSFALGSDVTLIEDFDAYLRHSLLYEPKLLLSDSSTINNGNFRQCLQKNRDLLSLLRNEALVIARRDNGDGPIEPLVSIRDRFARGAGAERQMNPGYSGREDVFFDNADLEVLERCETRSYSAIAVASSYTQRMIDAVKTEGFAAVAGSHYVEILSAITGRLEERGGLAQGFFGLDGAGSLRDKLAAPEAKEIVAKHLVPIELAIYGSGIPFHVGADLVFSPQHIQQQEILRRLQSVEGKDSDSIDTNHFDTNLLRSVLLDAPVRHFIDCRRSKEFSDFQTALAIMREQKDPHDEKFIQCAVDLHNRLMDYQKKIYSEFKLQFRFSDFRNIPSPRVAGLAKGAAWLISLAATYLRPTHVRVATVTSIAHALETYFVPSLPLTLGVAVWYGARHVPTVEHAEVAQERFLEKVGKLYERIGSATNNREISSVISVGCEFKDTVYRP